MCNWVDAIEVFWLIGFMTINHLRDYAALPLGKLLKIATKIHSRLDSDDIKLAALISIKTGRCPEDCKYCPQSARYKTHLKFEDFMSEEDFRGKLLNAKSTGAHRVCIGAAWRKIDNRRIPQLHKFISLIKEQGLEACATLGMADLNQLVELKSAGLDYYNHNVDTAEAYYPNVISTRTYADRIQTLENAKTAGLKLCTGGILGLGESREDRLQMLAELKSRFAELESLTINTLIATQGTPFECEKPVPFEDLIHFIALARITFPKAEIRLSAGRGRLTDDQHNLALLVGINSIFIGDKLLTATNRSIEKDQALFPAINAHKGVSDA